jgi:tRNA (guanosine-2'-O-)-methyltransferase
MDPEEKKSLINFLGNCMTEQRRELIKSKLQFRTNFITVVLEDIYNPHNASAVIRSCECFGIQNVHVIEQRNEYQLNPNVTRGSSKWISLNRYRDPDVNNIDVCFDHLKSSGYKILATTSRSDALPIQDYKLKHPIALTFGTEMEGLTEYAMEQADEFVHIPMRGFTESFNISVSAAICLYELSGKLYNSDLPWQLNETQMLDLQLDWYKKVLRRGNALEKEFFKLR